jgi:hypothetical protein
MKQRFKLGLTGKLFWDRDLTFRLNRPLDTNRVKIPVFTKGPLARLTSEPLRYRIGPYDLDLEEGRLSRGRARIRLEDLPFRLLVLLLERAGRIGTRDEVRQRLWPGNTFVEFRQQPWRGRFANCVKHYETTPMPTALSRRFPGAAIGLSPPSPSRTPTTWLGTMNRVRTPCPWKSHSQQRQGFSS